MQSRSSPEQLQKSPEVGWRSRWSERDALASLRVAGLYEFPLTGATYDHLLAIGEVFGPSRAWIANRFGSWTHACLAAGVESSGQPRESHSSWTDDDLIWYLSDFMTYRKADGTIHSYSTWRRTIEPTAPSAATIVLRLGSWTHAKLVAQTYIQGEASL